MVDLDFANTRVPPKNFSDLLLFLSFTLATHTHTHARTLSLSLSLSFLQYASLRLRTESRQTVDSPSHSEDAAYTQTVYGSLDDQETPDFAECRRSGR